MNHSGNANKMVSDTPRTDEAYFRKSATMYDMAGEMKRMEREINTANDRIKRLEQEALDKTSKAACKLIKRLEREVYALRLYGNKDCTIQADEMLKEEDKL